MSKDGAAPAKPVVEKDIQNGITRPKEGTKTGLVWAIADAISDANERPAFRKEVLEQAATDNLHPATAATQYGKWRKYHGLQGRGVEEVAEAPAEAK